jgi:hypothetical protein
MCHLYRNVSVHTNTKIQHRMLTKMFMLMLEGHMILLMGSKQQGAITWGYETHSTTSN